MSRKRKADFQLTKDNWQDQEVGRRNVKEGIPRANEEELKKRKRIRVKRRGKIPVPDNLAELEKKQNDTLNSDMGLSEITFTTKQETDGKKEIDSAFSEKNKDIKKMNEELSARIERLEKQFNALKRTNSFQTPTKEQKEVDGNPPVPEDIMNRFPNGNPKKQKEQNPLFEEEEDDEEQEKTISIEKKKATKNKKEEKTENTNEFVFSKPAGKKKEGGSTSTSSGFEFSFGGDGEVFKSDVTPSKNQFFVSLTSPFSGKNNNPKDIMKTDDSWLKMDFNTDGMIVPSEFAPSSDNSASSTTDSTKKAEPSLDSRDYTMKKETPVISREEKEQKTGEEGEHNVLETLVKCYSLETVDNKESWKERGKGKIRVNTSKSKFEERKSTNPSKEDLLLNLGGRLVLRREKVLVLLLNVPLFEKFPIIKMDDKRVTFVCNDFSSFGEQDKIEGEEKESSPEGKERSFLIRFQTREDCHEFFATVNNLCGKKTSFDLPQKSEKKLMNDFKPANNDLVIPPPQKMENEKKEVSNTEIQPPPMMKTGEGKKEEKAEENNGSSDWSKNWDSSTFTFQFDNGDANKSEENKNEPFVFKMDDGKKKEENNDNNNWANAFTFEGFGEKKSDEKKSDEKKSDDNSGWLNSSYNFDL